MENKKTTDKPCFKHSPQPVGTIETAGKIYKVLSWDKTTLKGILRGGIN